MGETHLSRIALEEQFLFSVFFMSHEETVWREYMFDWLFTRSDDLMILRMRVIFQADESMSSKCFVKHQKVW